MEVMWLTGRLAPDHKTIADFRKDNDGRFKQDNGQTFSHSPRPEGKFEISLV